MPRPKTQSQGTKLTTTILPPPDASEGQLKQAVKEVLDKEKSKEQSSAPAATVEPTISLSEVEKLINDRIAAEKEKQAQAEADAKAKQEVEELKQKLAQAEAEKEAAEQAAKTAKEQMDNLEAVTGIKGRSENYNPDTLSRFISSPDRMGTLAAETLQFVQSQSALKTVDGVSMPMPASTALDDWMLEHIKETQVKYGQPILSVRQMAKLPIFQEIEAYWKRNGLLCGRNPVHAGTTQAPVTGADLVGGFLPVLSSMIRYTHRGGYIFWQFPDVQLNFQAKKGDNIQIPRYALNAEPAADSAWLLSGKGAFTDITTDSQGTETGVVDVYINEYGMGKPGVNENRPYMVPNFIEIYSMLGVMESFMTNLYRNYMQFEDRMIRGLFAPTSAVVYNNGDSVTDDVLDLNTNSNGTMTVEFLHSLYSHMASDLLIPTYDDGCYILACTTKQREQIRKSYASVTVEGLIKPSNTADAGTIINLLPALTDTDRVSGYFGKYGNFHCFETNTYATGAAGTSGVQNETTGAGARLTRTAFAFGKNSIGRGVGMPFEIRSQSGEILWNRAWKGIWLSHEGFGAIDVDATGYNDTSDVPQQTRVLKVNTVDTPM